MQSGMDLAPTSLNSQGNGKRTDAIGVGCGKTEPVQLRVILAHLEASLTRSIALHTDLTKISGVSGSSSESRGGVGVGQQSSDNFMNSLSDSVAVVPQIFSGFDTPDKPRGNALAQGSTEHTPHAQKLFHRQTSSADTIDGGAAFGTPDETEQTVTDDQVDLESADEDLVD